MEFVYFQPDILFNVSKQNVIPIKMFQKNTELKPFHISNDSNADLFNVIRINTELNVDIKYLGKNISTNWNIDKDIVGVENIHG